MREFMVVLVLAVSVSAQPLAATAQVEIGITASYVNTYPFAALPQTIHEYAVTAPPGADLLIHDVWGWLTFGGGFEIATRPANPGWTPSNASAPWGWPTGVAPLGLVSTGGWALTAPLVVPAGTTTYLITEWIDGYNGTPGALKAVCSVDPPFMVGGKTIQQIQADPSRQFSVQLPPGGVVMPQGVGVLIYAVGNPSPPPSAVDLNVNVIALNGGSGGGGSFVYEPTGGFTPRVPFVVRPGEGVSWSSNTMIYGAVLLASDFL